MVYYESGALCHYGLKGMKWGTRRWQYQDGRFNDDGKARYFGKNSSHRPDSVRKLQGDPPKQKKLMAVQRALPDRQKSLTRRKPNELPKTLRLERQLSVELL